MDGAGGGIWTQLSYELVSITDSEISGNVIDGNYNDGGGIWAGSLVLTRSIVKENVVKGRYGNGGGIHAGGLVSRALEIVDSIVSENSTAGDNGAGGGIWMSSNGVPAKIIRSTISGNTTSGSSSPGAGIYASHRIEITQSTITGNEAIGVNSAGGGIYARSGFSVLQSTISNNATAGLGGGIYAGSGQIGQIGQIRNSAIALNRASSGGGVFMKQWTTIMLENSIVASNLTNSPTGVPDDIAGQLRTQIEPRYSLIGINTYTDLAEAPVGSPDGSGNLIGGPIAGSINPKFYPLNGNGGLTQTYALQADSPAINMGDPNFDPSDPDGDPLTDDAMLSDQRGLPYGRESGGRIDIGAFEAQPQPADFDNDGDADGMDFLLWQRGFGTAGPEASKQDGDADGDADVDADDLALWQLTFGAFGGAWAVPTTSASVVLRMDELHSNPLELDSALAAAVFQQHSSIPNSIFLDSDLPKQSFLQDQSVRSQIFERFEDSTPHTTQAAGAIENKNSNQSKDFPSLVDELVSSEF